MKLLLNLWFGKSHTYHFSISNKVKEVDVRLLSINPPNNISRCPRSIEFHRKYFKASELRSFLLYFGPAVLFGILPKLYYEHFLLLNEAIFILLRDSISTEELEHSERLLIHFCIMFAPLYGDRYQTSNIHSLLHLADNVRELGPLWTHSCFHFEDKNGFLLKLVHGTQHIQFQLISAVAISKRLPELENDFLQAGTNEYAFYKKLAKVEKGTKNETQLSNDCFAVGGVTYRQLASTEYDAIAKVFGSAPANLKIATFSQLRRCKCLYHCKL